MFKIGVGLAFFYIETKNHFNWLSISLVVKLSVYLVVFLLQTEEHSICEHLYKYISEPPLSSIRNMVSPVVISVIAQTAKSPIIPTNEIEQLDRSKLANILAILDDCEVKTHLAPVGNENWAFLLPKKWRPLFICLCIEMCAMIARWHSPWSNCFSTWLIICRPVPATAALTQFSRWVCATFYKDTKNYVIVYQRSKSDEKNKFQTWLTLTVIWRMLVTIDCVERLKKLILIFSYYL